MFVRRLDGKDVPQWPAKLKPKKGKDMSATSFAQTPLSPEALERYTGQWVAVRNGEVVASGDSYDELRAHEGVTDTDAVYHVPSADSLFY